MGEEASREEVIWVTREAGRWHLEETVGQGEDGGGQVAGPHLAVPGSQQGEVQDCPGHTSEVLL